MENTFSINGATITVKEPTIRDAMIRDRILAVVREKYPADLTAVWIFSRFISQGTMEGDIQGWTWPPANATDDELIAAFEGWLNLPATVHDQWLLATMPAQTEAETDEKKASGKTS